MDPMDEPPTVYGFTSRLLSAVTLVHRVVANGTEFPQLGKLTIRKAEQREELQGRCCLRAEKEI